jgi:hypothetical protein
MSNPILYALAFGPLGFYLWMLAVLQSGTRPRLVSGLIDFTMLAFAIGGVLAFGPFGDLIARLLFRKPDWLDRFVIVSALGLCATVLARKALHRIVVYHVDPEGIRCIIEEVLNSCCGRFVPTLDGFEDQEQRLGVHIEVTKWWDCALIEAYGSNPEGLIQQLRAELKLKLRGAKRKPSQLSHVLYVASILVMLIPLASLFLSQPHTREVFRVLLQRLRGD